MYGYGTYGYGFNPTTGEDLNPNVQKHQSFYPRVNPQHPSRRTVAQPPAPFYPFKAPSQTDFGHLPQYPPNQAFVDEHSYVYPMAQYDHTSGTMQYHHQYIPTPYNYPVLTPGVSFAQHPFFANPSTQNIKTEPLDEQEAYNGEYEGGESVDATVDALSTLSMTSEEERTFSAQYDEFNVTKSSGGNNNGPVMNPLQPYVCNLNGHHTVTQVVQTEVSEPFYDYAEPQEYEWPQESDYTIQPDEAVTTEASDFQEPVYQNCDAEFVDYMVGLEDFKQHYTCTDF
uniref:YTH domain-containing protein n=2 Tax=Panagrellus redivivus TaxID=6233 RepID=A0A7E4VB71_PANRE